MKISKTLCAFIWAAVSLHVGAAGPQWTWEAGKQTNNGAITIKSTTGSTTYASVQNPTGAVVKTNQIAATQPPTVIVNAVASMPIKAVGDPCVATTSGTAPNQTADEAHAVTADRTSLLTCQSGVWSTTFKIGTNAKDYTFYDLPSVDYYSGYHYGRIWTFSITKQQPSFVLIHFKPRFLYIGDGAHFQTTISTNGTQCGTKLYTNIKNGNMQVDSVCAFVAQPNVTYSIVASYDNESIPAANYLVNSGSDPVLTILAI